MGGGGSSGSAKKADKGNLATRHDMFVEKFSAIPEIAQLGPLFKSSQPAELTESETDPISRTFFGSIEDAAEMKISSRLA